MDWWTFGFWTFRVWTFEVRGSGFWTFRVEPWTSKFGHSGFLDIRVSCPFLCNCKCKVELEKQCNQKKRESNCQIYLKTIWYFFKSENLLKILLSWRQQISGSSIVSKIIKQKIHRSPFSFLDPIASPCTYPGQWVSGWVGGLKKIEKAIASASLLNLKNPNIIRIVYKYISI